MTTALKNLVKDFHLLALPSTLWGIHLDPDDQFAAILHITFTLNKLTIDKSLLLTCENSHIKALIAVNNENVHIPNNTDKIQAISDIASILYMLNDISYCLNADSASFPTCSKYILRSGGSTLCPTCVVDSGYSIYQSGNQYQDLVETEPVQPLSGDVFYQVNNEANEVFTCSICGESSTSYEALAKHKDYHSKGRNFLCTTCGKVFTGASQLAEHTFIHLKDKPFKCKVCQRTFAKKYNLNVHSRLHSGEKPYICSKCGKTFATRSNLSTHMKSVHYNEKRHNCEFCSKSFVHPRVLRVHMRKHTGERPYMCQICGKVFAKNIHLTIHTRTHTGEKPYVCSLCGKGFSTTGNLNAHKKGSHHNEQTM